MPTTARTHTSAIDALEGALREIERACLSAQDAVSRRVAATTAAIADEARLRRRELDTARARLKAATKDDPVGELERAVARAEARLSAATQAQRLASQASAQASSATARFGREIPASVGEARAMIRSVRGDVDTYLGSGGGDASGLAPSAATSGSGSTVPGGGGIRSVPIGQIDTSDREVTSADFGKGYSPADLEWATNALHEVVMPALAAGHGAEYFSQRDTAENRVGTRSYSDTYSGFFGDDNAIRLAPSGGRYDVENGYHRIWVARQMGMTHVPARVVE